MPVPLVVLILAQAAGAAPSAATVPAVPAQCEDRRSGGDEIVVCARRDPGPSPYRISQPPASQQVLPKAEVQLADGVSASADTEQADVGGFPSNRAMIRIKIKF